MFGRYSLLFIALIANFTYAQQKFLRKGDAYYNNLEYSLAVIQYQKAYKKGYDTPEILQKLGDSYYYMANLKEAYNWYQELYRSGIQQSPEFYFRYAHTLKASGKESEAKEVLKTFNDISSGDSRGNLLLKTPNFPDSIKTQTSLYAIKNMAINSPEADFGAMPYQDKVIFTSSRGGKFQKKE